MQKKKITIPAGCGADPAGAARLVQTANEFSSKIYLEYAGTCLNAKSIMGMMSLRAASGDAVDIITDGADEEQALRAIAAFFEA